jgi:hypothetical protein
MTPERELWACALLVEREHGAAADAFIAERVTTLARAGDMAGVERWRAIADKLDQLRDGGLPT